MVFAGDFSGKNDSEILQNAINGRGADGVVVISARAAENRPVNCDWLLDSALVLPENTTVILRNCKLKLSDRCRDNFFRSANCGLGIAYPEKIKNIHIKGEGLCVLEGADHPRATGDGGKILACPCPYETEDLCRLADWIPEGSRAAGKVAFWDRHSHSYGTDSGKPGESQYGDWRGIGILFANVENFSIENIKIKDSHGWAISLEACSHGRVEKIEFDACMHKEIDGMQMNMENQDGIDIRNGCHDITIADITGHTGDDMIALTAIAGDKPRPGGELQNTHVMHSDWTKREKDIHDITIKNIRGYSNLCYMVRLLPANTRIWNVIIDGVMDTSPDELDNYGCIMLGTADGGYGKNTTDGMKNIVISNVIANSREAIVVGGYIKDSVIGNVISRNADCPCISVRRENGLENVQTCNLCSAGKDAILRTETPEDYPI